MRRRAALNNGRRRRARNGAGEVVLASVMPYAIGAIVLFFVYQKYGGALGLINTKAQDPTQGSSDTAAANTVGQLISNPTNEVATLGTDVSHITTGIGGLVESSATSAENAAGQAWASFKSYF